MATHPFPDRLTRGYHSFVRGRLREEQNRYRQLAQHGQSPDVMVIGCADSRVSPTAIFDTGPGELFIVRNVANLIPPYEPDGGQRAVSAALEFAVHALRVNHIVVLGHAGCGGVNAFIEGMEPLSPGDFIGRWMALLAPAAQAIEPRRADESAADYRTRLEQASLVQGLKNLMTFPFVRTRVEAGTLALHAAYFGVASGALLVLDQESGTFKALATEPTG